MEFSAADYMIEDSDKWDHKFANTFKGFPSASKTQSHGTYWHADYGFDTDSYQKEEEKPWEYPAHIIMKKDMKIKDVVKEHVLPLLPAKSLTKFRAVSKEWDKWIASPLLTHQQSFSCQSFSGYFYQDVQEGGVPMFLSLDHSTIGVPSEFLEFLPEGCVKVLSSCSGLLLCQGSEKYYVCNPATQDWKMLPLPQYYHGDEPAVVLAFEPSLRNIEAYYHVICAFPMLGQPIIGFEIYSSESNTWSCSSAYCTDLENPKLLGGGSCMKGVAYYETKSNKVLAFDVKNEIPAIISLPVLQVGRQGSLTQMEGGEQYYNNNNQWNRRASMDHVMKVPQGEMGTQGSWAAATPHQATNSSSEFGSGYSGQAGGLPPQSPNVNVGGLGGFSQSQFTYEELAKATDGFSQANLLGQGGFGYVHKGVLTDGRVVAIKSLKAGSGQGEREFQAEVEIISRVHHRHLVSLVGYCIANGQRMLVYEYVDNKTLEFHLHGKGQPVMDWETRLKIALGSAKGLAYLHEDCQHRIIHRDIKAANILLDLNYEALVADFGLAKLTSDNNTHVSTRVMGTFGYLAPEYASSGKLTEKSDVFSYGVMLLELITGKRPVDPSNMMEDSLVDWARPLLTRALEEGIYDELVDARLEGNYDKDELHRMIACGAASIRHSAKRRPKMSQIVRALDGNSSLEDLNDNAKPGKTPSFAASSTSAYDTGMYNADMMKFRKMILPTQEFNSSEHGTSSD